MPVSLIRFSTATEAATLVAGTTRFRSFKRTRNPEPGPPIWLPDVPRHGYFDYYDGTLVALYRIPESPEVLWFQVGAKRVSLSGAVTSTFSPTFDDKDELSLDSSSVDRRFTLLQDGAVVLDFEYRLNDRELRLYRSMDPFPGWPDEESNYDLCLLLHGLLAAGTWPQVLPSPDGPRGTA